MGDGLELSHLTEPTLKTRFGEQKHEWRAKTELSNWTIILSDVEGLNDEIIPLLVLYWWATNLQNLVIRLL